MKILQDKSKGRHGGSTKPEGFYTGKDKHYVYGDNTPRKKGNAINILFYVLPIVMVVILALGSFLSYHAYVSSSKGEETVVKSNDDYISKEQQKTLYKIVSVADPLERNYVPTLKDFGGVKVSTMIYDSLNKMVNAAKKDGVDLKIRRGYVSYDDQNNLYSGYVNTLLNTGKYTQTKAESIANRRIADSGNSERQLGLSVEFDSEKRSTFNKSEAYQWLIKYGAEYGFIQRYTKENEQVTAMDSDYTLWRYVGKNNSLLARKLGLNFNTLIDYLES